MDSLASEKICPKHHDGYIFMWYIKKYDGSYIYEFDDRKIPHWTESLRNKYLLWLNQAQQDYYRRNIGLLTNFKRIGLELFDNILMLFNPNPPSHIRENSFNDIKDKSQVKELGILGNRGNVYIDTDTGIIHVGDRHVNIYFMYQGSRYDLTNNSSIDYHNIIERHEISYEFDLMKKKRQTLKGQVLGWTIGYEGIYHLYNDIDYRVLYTLPLGRPNFITLSLKPKIDMDLEIHLSYLANDDSKTVHLKKNEESTFRIAF